MSTRSKLESIYFWLQRIIVPKLLYSQYFYEDLLRSQINSSTAWLDLGCGHQILPPWRRRQEQELVNACKYVVGIDYDLESLKRLKIIEMKVRGDITRLPFKGSSFDLVTANMVIEHVSGPERLFDEVSRVLRKGGLFAFHTPNRAGYSTVLARMLPRRIKHMLTYVLQGREKEDIFHTFYLINDAKTIKRLALQAGFEVMQLRLLNSSAILNVIPPLVVFELLWLRLLMTKALKPLRTNIIVVLRKL